MHPVGVLGRIGISSQNEAEIGVGLPVSNGVGNASLIGQIGINGVGNDTFGPSVLASGDHETMFDFSPHFGAANLRISFHLLYGAENDISFEHRQAVNLGILHGF
jgi:hypothetical protein